MSHVKFLETGESRTEFCRSLDQPQDFTPSCHGGVESQQPWFDIHDDLPRARCDESRALQKAWASVGVTDRKDWKPG